MKPFLNEDKGFCSGLHEVKRELFQDEKSLQTPRKGFSYPPIVGEYTAQFVLAWCLASCTFDIVKF